CFGSATVNAEIAHLPRPACRAAGSPEFVFEIDDFLFSLLQIFARAFKCLLSSGGFRPDSILAIVDVALLKQLRVQPLQTQINNLKSSFSALDVFARVLKCGAPKLFITAFVIRNRKGNRDCGRVGRSGGICRWSFYSAGGCPPADHDNLTLRGSLPLALLPRDIRDRLAETIQSKCKAE